MFIMQDARVIGYNRYHLAQCQWSEAWYMEIEELLNLCETKDPGAALICGYLFENGVIMKGDKKKARRNYLIAAKLDIATAQYALALMYGAGEGGKKDRNKAYYWARRAAELGNPAAQFYLGYALEVGVGVERNIKEALHWKEKAANQGFIAALRDLGIMFAEGVMGEKDLDRAEYYFRKAVEAGDRDSVYFLATFLLEHRSDTCSDEAMQMITGLAEMKHAGALRQISYAYHSGRYGFPKDEKKAKEYFDQIE